MCIEDLTGSPGALPVSKGLVWFPTRCQPHLLSAVPSGPSSALSSATLFVENRRTSGKAGVGPALETAWQGWQSFYPMQEQGG